LPPTSFESDLGLLARQLPSYDRHRDLLPLLRTWAYQDTAQYGVGGGQLRGYDLEALQVALGRQVWGSGAAAVVLELRHFRFAGEFRHVETLLSSLCSAVQQVGAR
jgi:hypothetical protein